MTKYDNNTKSPNFADSNKIFMLGGFNEKDTFELIGNISDMVDKLPWSQVYDPTQRKEEITNPYKLQTTHKVIDVYINSRGGQLDTMNSISGLLNLARAKGAIIRTTVIGGASSCGSLLAVQGTPNFRIMHEMSYHYIHYGQSWYAPARDGEIDNAIAVEKNVRNKMKELYLENTKISKGKLDKMMQTEYNQFDAFECLDMGLCDWVLTNKGKFVNSKMIQQKPR